MNSIQCVSNSYSSSTSSIAPLDFNINNNSITVNHKKTLNDENKSNNNKNKSNNNSLNSKKWLLRCPVCLCDENIFFCSDCIKNGDFTYSKERFPERFADKRLKYFKLKSEQILISDKIEQQLELKVIKDELEFKFRSLERKVENLNKALNEAKQRLNNSRNNLIKSKQNQNECKERHNKLIGKVNDVKQYLIHRQNAIDKRIESKDNLNSYIKELIHQRVSQLKTYIFPIEMISSDETNNRKSMNSLETTPLLTISDSNSYNSNYTVIEPWIAGNGDYSLYGLFALSKRDYPNKESTFRNPEYRIGAALAYITQLLNIIAFYLDIRLPKRLSYSEFFVNDLNEVQFAHKVAKLNANVLHLCLSQNVDSELLHPRQTVKNLLYVLNSNSFSGIRNGPIIMRADFLEMIENSLLEDLYLIDEPDIEEFDNNDADEELIDYDWVEHNLPDLHFTSSGQQTSIAGYMSTAAASVFSFWRTATRQQ